MKKFSILAMSTLLSVSESNPTRPVRLFSGVNIKPNQLKSFLMCLYPLPVLHDGAIPEEKVERDPEHLDKQELEESYTAQDISLTTVRSRVNV